MNDTKKTKHEIKLVELKKELEGHKRSIASLAMTPDGKQIVSLSRDSTMKLWDIKTGDCLATLEGHKDNVWSLAVTPNGKQIVSGSRDRTIRLWDINGGCLATLEGHESSVESLAVTPDGKQIVSGSQDGDIKLWGIRTGNCLATLEGHKTSVDSLAVTPDGKQIVSGSDDRTIKLWDINGDCLATLEGHKSGVYSLAVTPDSKQIVSGSEDGTIKLWDISGGCLATLEGHKSGVYSVAVTLDGKQIVSGSGDGTIKLWDIRTGNCLATLEGHRGEVLSVAVTLDGKQIVSGAGDGKIIIWEFKELSEREESLVNKEAEELRVRYSCAKVVLVGESGVGKSGLGYRLAEDKWVVTESTHGANVWELKFDSLNADKDVKREVLLWDFAGQPDYRIIHQLYFDETAVALVVFNPADPDDPFRGIGHWEKALTSSVGHNLKLLVAGRSDRGGATITRDKIEEFRKERGYDGYFSTSAKLGNGCKELKDAISNHIQWDKLPRTSTTKIFKKLKEAIVKVKNSDVVLIRYDELRRNLQSMIPNESFDDGDLRTSIKLLANHGLIKPLSFGDFILLQPEQLNNYASAVIRSAREKKDGIAALPEKDVLEGKIDFKDMKRLGKEDEKILLLAMVEMFTEKSLCIREKTNQGELLVFPSQFNLEMPEIKKHPNILVKYKFSGALDNIYTTLVVRLAYSGVFKKEALWRYAAEFLTPTNKKVGFKMAHIGEGVGEITAFFDDSVPDDSKIIFIKYIHEHLKKWAEEGSVGREREYSCPKCNALVEGRREAIKNRLLQGKDFISCDSCDNKIPLLDLIEQKFPSSKLLRKVQEVDEKAQINIDNENRELILVGQATTTINEAGQIYRGYTNSDHGIDGEIEFKNNKGKASGKKVYLQLKSGDSYLYPRKDGKEIFTIKNASHILYWQNHAYDVYLVIRTSDGEIRWMNITEYLKNRKDTASKKVIFTGKPFNASVIRAIRDSILPLETGKSQS